MSDDVTRISVDIPAGWFLSSNDRVHWARKSRCVKWARTLAFMAARNAGVRDLGPSLVTVEIHRPKGGQLRDPDNAQPTWKPCIDGFTDAGLWPDDSSEWVTGPIPSIAAQNLRTALHYRLDFTIRPRPDDLF